MSQGWAEKYRPQTLAAMAGNAQAVAAMGRWADSWTSGPPSRRALLLVGPPGCGKTSAALALAAERGWGLIELNASDTRSAAAIERVAGHGAVNETFAADGAFFSSRQGQRKLVVLDEADSLYEGAAGTRSAGQDYSDRGGKAAIVRTVIGAQQPIVVIVNDAYALTRGSGGRLGRLALKIAFRAVDASAVSKLLARVAAAEGVRVAPEALEALGHRCGGDVRSALNDLQALCEGRGTVTLDALAATGRRDRSETVFDALRVIFRSGKVSEAVQAAWDADESPQDLLPWIDENLPAEYRDPRSLVDGFEALWRADRMLGRARRYGAYRLWGYAAEWESGGVAVARRGQSLGYARYQFPQWIRRMGSSRGVRGVRDATATKIGRGLHLSKRAVLRDMLPWLRLLAGRDDALAVDCADAWGLEPAEFEFLLGPELGKRRIEGLLDRLARRREGEPEPDDAAPGAAEPSEAPKEEGSAAPASTTLFDF